MGSGSDRRDDLVLKAMVAMAACDGETHRKESSAMAGLYERATGKRISEETVRGAIEDHASSARELMAELASAAGRLDRTTKENIVRGAYLVLLADDTISAQERKILTDIAAALKIPEVHFGAILEDLTG